MLIRFGPTELEDHEVLSKIHQKGTLREEEEPLILLHALAGYDGPKTMRIVCTADRRQLVILIDSGLTHNFVSQKIAQVLQLAVTPVDEFWVKVANGEKLCSNERYENVPISIQGSQFLTTLYALPLHGLDVVLGVQWLETLGLVTCDWRRMTMCFRWENQWVTLSAQPTKPAQGVKIQTLERELHGGGEFFALIPKVFDENLGARPNDIQELLREFSQVLAEPKGVPPSREFDHKIPL